MPPFLPPEPNWALEGFPSLGRSTVCGFPMHSKQVGTTPYLTGGHTSGAVACIRNVGVSLIWDGFAVCHIKVVFVNYDFSRLTGRGTEPVGACLIGFIGSFQRLVFWGHCTCWNRPQTVAHWLQGYPNFHVGRQRSFNSHAPWEGVGAC